MCRSKVSVYDLWIDSVWFTCFIYEFADNAHSLCAMCSTMIVWELYVNFHSVIRPSKQSLCYCCCESSAFFDHHSWNLQIHRFIYVYSSDFIGNSLVLTNLQVSIHDGGTHCYNINFGQWCWNWSLFFTVSFSDLNVPWLTQSTNHWCIAIRI